MKTCSIYITIFIRCNKCIRFKDDISSLRADLSPVKFRQQLVNHYFSLSLSSASECLQLEIRKSHINTKTLRQNDQTRLSLNDRLTSFFLIYRLAENNLHKLQHNFR